MSVRTDSVTLPQLGGLPRIGVNVPNQSEWILYSSTAGRAVVESEIQGCALSADELGALQRMLDRIESGRALKKDTKYLKQHKVFEARLDGDRRIFRLLFVKRRNNTVLVGLYFTAKKSDKLPKAVFATTSKRLADWDKRHPE